VSGCLRGLGGISLDGVGGDARDVVVPKRRLDARLRARESAFEAAREAALVGEDEMTG
jgi:hypothetical protein